MSKTRTLAILVFDDVEVLDFCGPFEVFSVASRFTDPPATRSWQRRSYSSALPSHQITSSGWKSWRPRSTKSLSFGFETLAGMGSISNMVVSEGRGGGPPGEASREIDEMINS